VKSGIVDSKNRKSVDMANIEMDHFDFSTNRLVTAEVDPCICFIVIVNNGQEVFIEHRSDVFFQVNLIVSLKVVWS
jgi:hypothetical protein